MWKAIMTNGEVHTDDFRGVDMESIKTLSTSTVGSLEISIQNGNIFVNNELITRGQVMNHYNKGPYKPIQYRKVVNLIGMFDFDKLKEELEAAEQTPEFTYILELNSKRAAGTITENEMQSFGIFIAKYTGQLPFREFEVQTLGYSYQFDNQKVQVEFESNPEIESIVMKTVITDLIQQKKMDPQYIRLI